MQQNKKLKQILEKLEACLKEKPFVLIAIDGRCGAGKTTLAGKLQEVLSCNVIPMDDFFLQPKQRTEERLATPGENIDHERFLKEVLFPLSQNKVFSYRPYRCAVQDFGEPVKVLPNKVTIVEGAYACHPSLWQYYDLRIFLDVDPEIQMQRIICRNGASNARIFQETWIPLEEAYLKAFKVKERVDISIA